MNEEMRTSSRKTRVGKVVSDKMDKTCLLYTSLRAAPIVSTSALLTSPWL